MLNQCHIGDCRALMKDMASAGVRAQMCVTSPPYWGLRDYGAAGQIGLEPTLAEWVDVMVDVFRCVRDVLTDDGTVWLNLGDGYASTGGPGWQGKNGQRADRRFTLQRDTVAMRELARRPPDGYKPKDLLGMPWRVAFALQDDGWYLRQDIIWHKPNPMPESITDRCTKAHEYMFLLSKTEQYYCDMEAIKEPASPLTNARQRGNGNLTPAGWATGKDHSAAAHQTARNHRKVGAKLSGAPRDSRAGASARMGRGAAWRKLAAADSGTKNNDSFDEAMAVMPETRNKRSVWTIPSEPFAEAHFATFPTALIEPCVLAGSRKGDVVLDPFMGSGTTAQVAEHLGRQWIGCELQADYLPMQAKLLSQRALAL